jgi:hypothetical protein
VCDCRLQRCKEGDSGLQRRKVGEMTVGCSFRLQSWRDSLGGESV